jgi:hypothetical protein
MATLVVTKASNMQCGDVIVQDGHHYQVQSIDGPDHTGTYDVHAKDEQGKDKFVIVQNIVTIIM